MQIQSIQIYFFQTDASARVMISVVGGGFDGALPVIDEGENRVIKAPITVQAGEGQGAKQTTLLKITLSEHEIKPPPEWLE